MTYFFRAPSKWRSREPVTASCFMTLELSYLENVNLILECMLRTHCMIAFFGYSQHQYLISTFSSFIMSSMFAILIHTYILTVH